MDEKVVLITGASSGLGKKIAELLLKKGHVIYAASRNLDKMKDLEEKGAFIKHLDVSDKDSIDKCIKEIMEKSGRIDTLINNAGYGCWGVFESLSDDDARKQFEVNVFGLANVMKSVLPIMRAQKKGRIINIASAVGFFSLPVMSWYSASKHAVEGLSSSVRQEVKSFGIDVVVLEPGAMDTGFLEVALDNLESKKIDKDYKNKVEAFKREIPKYFNESKTLDKVVLKLDKVVDAKKVKARYRLGMDAKFAYLATKILPNSIIDRIVLHMYKMK